MLCFSRSLRFRRALRRFGTGLRQFVQQRRVDNTIRGKAPVALEGPDRRARALAHYTVRRPGTVTELGEHTLRFPDVAKILGNGRGNVRGRRLTSHRSHLAADQLADEEACGQYRNTTPWSDSYGQFAPLV